MPPGHPPKDKYPPVGLHAKSRDTTRPTTLCVMVLPLQKITRITVAMQDLTPKTKT